MAGKHTEGPWRVEFNSADTMQCRCVEILGGGDLIGSVAYLQSYAGHDYDDRDEVLANARLIAAAPDLLEAARAAYELLKIIHDETGKVGTQLAAAIRRATQPLPPQSEE